MHNPLHLAVAEELQKKLVGRGELIRDLACGGAQHIPLFIGLSKGLDNRVCDVDLLIILNGQIRVIVEIEESGFLPTKICGKFLQSAIATHFIHNSQSGHAIPYCNRVVFIQVLDGSKCLKQGSQKILQGKLIEQKIRSMLPLKGSSITNYHLFFIKGFDDRESIEFVSAIVSDILA
jgi:hypothetical protein